jgi:hypothetical protein
MRTGPILISRFPIFIINVSMQLFMAEAKKEAKGENLSNLPTKTTDQRNLFDQQFAIFANKVRKVLAKCKDDL